jgi:hypothetical protein
MTSFHILIILFSTNYQGFAGQARNDNPNAAAKVIENF